MRARSILYYFSHHRKFCGTIQHMVSALVHVQSMSKFHVCFTVCGSFCFLPGGGHRPLHPEEGRQMGQEVCQRTCSSEPPQTSLLQT